MQIERIEGKIIKISPKGYGFIISEAKKFTRFFFHWTELHSQTKKFDELREGMKVEFAPVDAGEKGWRALHIKVLNDGAINGKDSDSKGDSNTVSNERGLEEKD